MLDNSDMRVAITLVGLLGCTGVIAGPGSDDSPPDGSESPRSPRTPELGDPRAFDARPEAVELLPFETRLQRVADVVGLPTDDAVFGEMHARRLELGGHDYGAGVAPDLSWSARRLVSWARAVLPVCASPAMRERYPDFREGIEDFTLAAYGRRAEAADREALEDAIASAAGLEDDARYRATCVALLSSSELVVR